MIQVVTEELGMNLDNIEPHMLNLCTRETKEASPNNWLECLCLV
jgi:hypothetical protein